MAGCNGGCHRAESHSFLHCRCVQSATTRRVGTRTGRGVAVVAERGAGGRCGVYRHASPHTAEQAEECRSGQVRHTCACWAVPGRAIRHRRDLTPRIRTRCTPGPSPLPRPTPATVSPITVAFRVLVRRASPFQTPLDVRYTDKQPAAHRQSKRPNTAKTRSRRPYFPVPPPPPHEPFKPPGKN